MLNRIRLLHLVFFLGGCVLSLSLVRLNTVHAATPTEYKQIYINNPYDVPAILTANAKQGWEFVQVYYTGNMGGNPSIYVILRK